MKKIVRDPLRRMERAVAQARSAYSSNDDDPGGTAKYAPIFSAINPTVA